MSQPRFPIGPLTMDQFTALVPAPAVELTTTNEEIEILFGRAITSASRTYRLPSVKDAMGVPAIQSAVALIAGTTGMLSVQGYQRGVLMAETPRLLARPDPRLTPQAFYSGAAASIAKHGEVVWWIANRDGAGLTTALVEVPLHELGVTENLDNRLRPRYQWGKIVSTRWTPATPDGQFVHVMYPLAEPFALRGEGPLQLCKAATSVSVESQAWAAQFYADGGNPSVVIKHAGELSPEEDEDGLNEAERLRAQWVNKPHNVPRVIDQNIESVEYKEVSTTGAQMLDARAFQVGDSARTFRIPGPLLEFQQSGGSLTYQNRTDLKTEFWETCLQPLYIEPIEQALSDLLPRSIVGRFNAKGFLRADIKTRFDVHGLAISNGIYDAPYAQREEGILPGDVEFAPVPFAPAAAVPATVQRAASAEVRDIRCPTCSRLVVRASGTVEGWCRHCKAEVWEEGPLTLAAPDPDQRFMATIMALAAREQPAPIVNNFYPQPVTVNTPEQPVSLTIERGAVEVSSPVTVEPAVVNVTTPEVRNEISVEPTPVAITVAPTPVEITNAMTVEPTPVEITVSPTPVTVEVPETRVELNVPAQPAPVVNVTTPDTLHIASMPSRGTRRSVTKRDGRGQIAETIDVEEDI